MIKRLGLLLCLPLSLLLWSPQAVIAAIDTYEFATEQQRDRYNYFSKVLRCPMCQNQNLDGSDSKVSEDLRRELHRLIVEDYDDDQIIDFMVTRYGDFILYDPPVNKDTVWLWVLPVILLLGGVGIVVARARASAAESAAESAEASRQRGRALLEDDDQ